MAPLWQLQFDFTSNPNKPLLKQAAIHQTSIQFDGPGPTPTVSSNGNTNGIVWVCENNSSGQAVLHAYDATNVETELFNSGNIGVAAKFAVPTVCNGKVYVGTANSVDLGSGRWGSLIHNQSSDPGRRLACGRGRRFQPRRTSGSGLGK